MSQSGATGYSGKPVWQKLGLTPMQRVLVRHAPSDYAALVGAEADALMLVGTRDNFELAHVFAVKATQLANELKSLSARLPATGVIWASWPKKGSDVATDITEDTVRTFALPIGLVDIKVCAIDATWSGLKLMWRRDRRADKPRAQT
ncbi:DUF3052 domain-containing protein [Dokdonella soli]|uniref:DUF3052 family protein n=1 Tax=Dokdonella soli TaxID=529810 RepID=A0ABN1ILJ0_9GAMM